MEIVVHSKKSVSTKVSKEIVPFQQELPTWECDVKNDPIGQTESDKKNPTLPKNLRLRNPGYLRAGQPVKRHISSLGLPPASQDLLFYSWTAC